MKIVGIVGADGAGKSTVTAEVGRSLAGVRVVDRWDVVGNPKYPTASCLVPDERLVRSCAARMSSTPRLLFLAWVSVLALTDEQSDGRPEDVLVLDGYWMKHAASEIAYGADKEWVEEFTAGLPRPDLVVYLRTDAHTAWSRKAGAALPYECGMDLTCTRESFVSHQKEIHRVLDDWSSRHGWTEVDAGAPLEAVLDAVRTEVARA